MSLFKYDFKIGDEVKLVDCDDAPNQGQVIARRWAPCSLLTHFRLFPSRYYVIMLQEEYNTPNQGRAKTDLLAIECPESKLVALTGKDKEAN